MPTDICPCFASEIWLPIRQHNFGDGIHVWPTNDYAYGGYFADDTNYEFSQQQKDFIKLQFKYMTSLKAHLADGTLAGYDVSSSKVIPPINSPTADQQQAYYDHNIWLAQQSLSSPSAAWWDEFKTAIDQEDLQWLANQVGEDVGSVSRYVGKAAGTAVASVTSGIASGVVAGVEAGATRMSLPGWLLVLAVGAGAYFYLTKGNPVAMIRSRL